jgi:hypothetical protein
MPRIYKPLTEEHKSKISKSRLGQHMTPETKLKMSIVRKGMKHTEETKSKISKNRSGISNDENHYQWKGEDVKYSGLHRWISRKLGKANKCEFADETCRGPFEWSNISHTYKRNVNDFQPLCSSHHKRYDKAYVQNEKNKI